MRFEFVPRDSLPRLAWCARVRRGVDVVEVQHGPWLEAAADWFVEGAWPGPFGAGGVVETLHLVGTAGRAEPGRVVFCTPSSLSDQVQSIRVDDDLYVSNSLVFLLRIAGDEPDPRYPYYAVDRVVQLQTGIRYPDKRLWTARGRRVDLHDHCNIEIRPDLSIRRIEKPLPPPPVDHTDLVGQLERTIAGVVANAADPARRHRRYRPVVALSRGYESPALAVLLRRHGAREALTFTVPDDDGTLIGTRLGYDVTGYDPAGFRNFPGAVEAEFLAVPPGSDVVMAVCEPQMVGALLVTGRVRGNPFGTEKPGGLMLVRSGPAVVGGTTLGEFRLRVGCLQFTPLNLMAIHAEAAHRISVSAELKPWSVGGGYDKPVLRWIVEEAGIPRDWFGVSKRATAYRILRSPADLSVEAAADFTAYLGSLGPISLRRRWRRRGLLCLRRLRIDGIRRRLHAALGLRPPRRFLVFESMLVPLEMGFGIHWGHARIRSRYDPALTPREKTAVLRSRAPGQAPHHDG